MASPIESLFIVFSLFSIFDVDYFAAGQIIPNCPPVATLRNQTMELHHLNASKDCVVFERVTSGPVTYTDVENFCSALGSNEWKMLTLKTMQKKNEMIELMPCTSQQCAVWLGIKKTNGTVDEWIWADGTDFDRSIAPKIESNETSDECMIVVLEENNGSWKAKACDDASVGEIGFKVCEASVESKPGGASSPKQGEKTPIWIWVCYGVIIYCGIHNAALGVYAWFYCRRQKRDKTKTTTTSSSLEKVDSSGKVPSMNAKKM